MNILNDGILKGGRFGQWVYYVWRGKQYRRRYVVPTDPRTAGQLRSRAALAAASRAWSMGNGLTKEQREAWRAARAKIQSHMGDSLGLHRGGSGTAPGMQGAC